MTKAIVLEKHGGPANLVWQNIPDVPPLPEEVTIRQLFTSVNYADINFRNGTYKPPKLPIVLGREAVGIIEETGLAVKNFKVGDRVGYVSHFGGYSQRNNINEKFLIPIPNSIPNELAAASLLKGCTAQYLLRQTYNVKKGDIVLIHAAAGGVGLIACQWAKHLGATVIGTVSTEEKAKVARTNGCDHVINYLDQNFFDIVNDITNGNGVDYICDSVGKDTLINSMKSLKHHGTLAIYGSSSGNVDPNFFNRFLSEKFIIKTTLPGYINTRKKLISCSTDFFNVIQAGIINILIDNKLNIKHVSEAHRKIENRETIGSTILEID